MVTVREIVLGCSCQLIIGSFEGNGYQCLCKHPNDCQLHPDTRKELLNYQRVQEAKERSKAEYDAMKKLNIE